MTDEQRTLILMAQAGDTEAFGALAAARRSGLLVLLAATVGDWDEAEDVLQDALWRAFTGLRSLREPAGFDAWLRRIALNVARDYLRAGLARMRREGEPAGDAADLDRLFDAVERVAEDTSVCLTDREACADILIAIGTLPPLSRRAGRLAWVTGLPQPQVADLLGISEDSVRSALYRGRRQLGAMFYAKGDWRKDVEVVPEGTIRVAGYPHVDEVVTRLRESGPNLQVAAVDAHAEADVRMRLFWAEAPGRAGAPPPAEALPLDGLADSAGFDLEPFADRLARFTVGGRLYALPHHDTPHLFVYNADLLQRAGLHLPRADWTWDEFFGSCRRCAAAGLQPINMCSPNAWEVALLAEQLGATRDHLEPVREALAFVQDWQRQGWTAPYQVPDWAFGRFLAGEYVFYIMQAGHPAHWFRDPRFRPIRWGVAPMPRFRRSDPPARYWFHFALQIPGTAPDPTAAFAVVRSLFTQGPVPEFDDLPAYRTPEAMGAWMAQPLPLGKECLLDLSAATDPLYEPLHLFGLPGGSEVLVAMIDGEITADEGLRRLRDGVDAYRAGERLLFRD